MNIYLELLESCSPFNCAVIEAYLNEAPGAPKTSETSRESRPVQVTISPEVKKKLDSFGKIEGLTVEELEYKLKSSFCPSPDKTSVIIREKKLINNFWKELTPPDLAGCDVKIFDKKSGTKTYHRSGNIISASFGRFESGQFGEFNHPILPTEAIRELGLDVDKAGLKILIKELEDCNIEVPNTVIHNGAGFSETFPIGFYGIKSIPITAAETNELQANNGTFSAETIANHHYQRLVLEGCAFTPLFSLGTKVPFDKNIFQGDNMSALHRLQRTLKRIQKDAESIDRESALWISGNVVNSKVIDASIFSDKIGMFTTTWVGHSITAPPIANAREILLLAIDVFWTMEQAILNKIYITDLNIGNILHYDMNPWVHLAGWEKTGSYSREYSWASQDGYGGSGSAKPEGSAGNVKPGSVKPGSTKAKVRVKHGIKIPNNFKRLVFVDLGTSIIENPSLGNRRIIDKNPPFSKNSRCDTISGCRSDILAVINFLAVINNVEGEFEEIINLNVNKNLFFQLIELDSVIQLSKEAEALEVAEKYHSKVFR